MKTKQIFIFTILFASFVIFASMRPENISNNYHNFSINDTIDTLKNNTNTTTLSLDDLGFGQDLENANQNLENANQDLENANQNLTKSKQDLQQAIAELEGLIQKEKELDKNIADKIKELANLKIEAKTLGEQIDSNEILGHLKELATSK